MMESDRQDSQGHNENRWPHERCTVMIVLKEIASAYIRLQFPDSVPNAILSFSPFQPHRNS